MMTIKKKKNLNQKYEIKSKHNALSIILLVFLSLYALTLFIVLGWGLMTSFKSVIDFTDHPYQFPKSIVNNFTTVFQEFKISVPGTDGVPYTVELAEMYLYSFMYALGSAFTATLVPCITAYACARFPFKFSKVIYSVVLVAMIVPTVGNLPSELNLMMTLGIYNQIWGLWIMKANFLGMYFLVFYGVFKGFPASYSEAAKIDGANNLTIMLRIAFPLVINVFATVMLINFVHFWNDYQTPLLYMSSFPTVAYGLFKLTRPGVLGKIANVPSLLTATMLVVFPILVLFIAFQKRLLGNLTVGGVKG